LTNVYSSSRSFDASSISLAGEPIVNNRVSGVGALVNAEIDRSEPVGTSQANFIVALGVDNIEAAQEALSEQITSWNYP
jgi:hypothetical protein